MLTSSHSPWSFWRSPFAYSWAPPPPTATAARATAIATRFMGRTSPCGGLWFAGNAPQGPDVNVLVVKGLWHVDQVRGPGDFQGVAVQLVNAFGPPRAPGSHADV